MLVEKRKKKERKKETISIDGTRVRPTAPTRCVRCERKYYLVSLVNPLFSLALSKNIPRGNINTKEIWSCRGDCQKFNSCGNQTDYLMLNPLIKIRALIIDRVKERTSILQRASFTVI